MAKDEQPGATDGYETIELGANARIADIPAQSVECLTLCDKIDAKASSYAAAPVFEFADVL